MMLIARYPYSNSILFYRNEVRTSKKSNKDTTQNGTKILVRNVPFQANRNELHEIFR